jgi:hypothetical protein
MPADATCRWRATERVSRNGGELETSGVSENRTDQRESDGKYEQREQPVEGGKGVHDEGKVEPRPDEQAGDDSTHDAAMAVRPRRGVLVDGDKEVVASG